MVSFQVGWIKKNALYQERDDLLIVFWKCNQPRFLLLGINIKVLMVVHRRGIRFHTFSQIFGTWLKRLSNQRPGLNFIKIEYSKHTLLIGVERIKSFDWDGPFIYTWLGELSPFVSLEKLLFSSLCPALGPLSSQYSLRNI